ncbi:LOW QUALITY PROTEIN: uncharacterized protein LOC114153253 [Xiphophorus couchianus]|uniref:LOW QUALITY PROTEIN: uncharacterized protein LOC114153253 n=1 Tax=Xiphophorus couchianus TaxID=32473 RepID=UPI0010167348|nr:LOW QUALITY PROTEIN: uncharacterized protein LOC114153253 [Xiphophorus couchianus]
MEGHYSHGLNRVDMYLKDIRTGVCAVEGEPVVEKESAATSLVDGNNLLGPVVGNFCMDLAIRKAKEVGVGWVVAHGSNHFGFAGYYSMQALKENMIMSETSLAPVCHLPTRGKERTLGTSPLSVAAPAEHGARFVPDTSAVALGKVRAGLSADPIPDGWGCDPEGHVTTDPKSVLTGGGLVPIGGSEATEELYKVQRQNGFKTTRKNVSESTKSFISCFSEKASLYNLFVLHNLSRFGFQGQFFVAINLENFAPGFTERMSALLSISRGQDPADPGSPVLAPGDPERLNMKKCEETGGRPYHINVVK